MIKRKQKAIAIVAHPDDETIWMGGFILSHPEYDWTIFALCRASDEDRAPKFHRVVGLYGAKGIMTDLDDEGRLNLKQATKAAREIIREEINGAKYDFVFTHGKNGEYGHYLHKAVHQAVVDCLETGVLKAKEIYCFNYQRAGKNKVPSMRMRSDSDLICELDQAEFARKRQIQSEVHGYPMDGIDVNYCTNPESFKARIT